MHVKRARLEREVAAGLKASPVTAILGPRQSGKTTLARRLAVLKRAQVFDLEVQDDVARLSDPLPALRRLKGLVVLDEIQRKPELFEILRALADRRPVPCRFLILGSASPSLLRRTSESLAGRVRFVEMGGFTLEEAGPSAASRLWMRGGMPNSFLAPNDGESWKWREDFITTFLERDIPQLEISIPAATLRRFWAMAAHYHGQVWNSSEVAGSLGVAHTTARRYLDLLEGAYMVRELPPWFGNLRKRVVKSPKVYLRDSGLLHTLLRLRTFRDLEVHPKVGASWEGFAMEQVLRRVGERDAFFWATHAGAELDLLVLGRGRKWGFEFKFREAPAITRSMRSAMEELDLARLWVVHPGSRAYPLARGIEALPLAGIDDAIAATGAGR